MKIVNDLIEILYYLFISIVAGTLVLFIELMIIANLNNIFMQFVIRTTVVFILYLISNYLKRSFFIILMIFYISMTAYILLFSGDNDKNTKANNNIIQPQFIFKTEEQKTKYTNGTIEEKIIILRDMNLSKKQIYKRLENDMKFRELIKDGDEKVEDILKLHKLSNYTPVVENENPL